MPRNQPNVGAAHGREIACMARSHTVSLMTYSYRRTVSLLWKPQESLMNDKDTYCTLVPYFSIHPGQVEAFKEGCKEFEIIHGIIHEH